jgi:hypothetical protein
MQRACSIRLDWNDQDIPSSPGEPVVVEMNGAQIASSPFPPGIGKAWHEVILVPFRTPTGSGRISPTVSKSFLGATEALILITMLRILHTTERRAWGMTKVLYQSQEVCRWKVTSI